MVSAEALTHLYQIYLFSKAKDEGLKNQGVDEAYLNILRNLYSKATSALRLHKDSEKFELGRGVRQGDNISSKLFTSCLQYAITNKISLENKGVRIDGEYLFHLIFADDIVLIATPHQSYRKCSKVSMTSASQ